MLLTHFSINLLYLLYQNIENYNKNNTYKVAIAFNPTNGDIITCINDELIYSINDITLKGNLTGFISQGKNTVFKQLLSEEL